ncbi:MAG: rRNA maturation RNase YbeY [Oscillospiraceae bacterium]|jgi:probable rRNA maturation factor|nr:rRNA maturation RNase YbeY [Oscillospiraceae bacterium]
MPAKLKVFIDDAQTAVKPPAGLRMLIRRACNAVAVQEDLDGRFEVGIRFVDGDEIHALNLQYRNVDRSTDVLSFPQGENGAYDTNPESGASVLGSIALNLVAAQSQAKLYGHSFNREVAYLTVHSMLHLLGYDHEKGGLESVQMREKEESVLTELGLPRGGSYV